jgi:glucose uptake protein GlcU
MTDARTVQLTFTVNDPELDDEEREKIAQKLLPQLKQLDGVEKVGRAEDSNLEEGSKSVLATLVGVLTAKVSVENVGKVLGFVGDRLIDKPIIIKLKVGEQEVEIEAKSRKELEEAEKVANNLLARMQGTSNA